MKSEYRIGRVWGIPINLHISLFLLMAYMAFRAADAGGWKALVFVLAFEVLLFTSIALHELGHSFVAIRKGCRVREITLMFIGGAAQMDQIPRRPRDELLMAIAGPAVSLLIGCLAITGALLLPVEHGWIFDWMATLLSYAGIANCILAGFNLLPAFPMDGGRVFRAMLTPKLGRLHATRLAALTGKGVAGLFALVGLFGLPGVPFLEDRNLALLLIAGFIFFVGEREYRQVQVEELMRSRGFGDGAAPPPPFASDTPPLDDHTVLISPPPYAKGPAQKAEIQRARPSSRLFE
jgi:Zn-dependent protease